MSRVGDLTIESIIRKYEHRQQALRSDLDAQDRPKGDFPLPSGASTPEFSFTIGRTEINRKLEDEERIQRTQKKQEGRMREEEGSFSTDRESILRQLEQAEERLARS
jgi:chromosome segregation ATPase